MSEIKHQFTGGKMNKDLDERLVPNGQYRDAMNIQVSTSEGSDVGTVQNILGNSLVLGQDFIGENDVCVGSIADEKNDKLYYFINQKNLLSNGSFDNNGEGWDVDTTAWDISNGQATAIYGGSGRIKAFAALYEGTTYRFTYDIVVPFQDDSGLLLANHHVANGLSNQNVSVLNENIVGTHSVEWVNGALSAATAQSPNGFFDSFRLWCYDDGDGTIDNLTIFNADEPTSSIIEYDSKTNTITPVFVDTVGDVLKFNPDNIITGINIIDDLLLWTDNAGEPKKINIPRCKAGTDSSGTIHTDLVVEGINEGAIKEEHITVIKKGPSRAPGINATSNKRSGHIYGPIADTGNGTCDLFYPPGDAYNEVEEGHRMWIGIQNEGGVNGTIEGLPPNLAVGDVIRVYAGNSTPTEGEKPVARLLIEDTAVFQSFYYSQTQNNFGAVGQAYIPGLIAFSHQTAFKVAVSTLITHTSSSDYWFELEQEGKGIFERKLPRFAYRYKYEDNEYSPVGPFSEVAFIPGEFNYHPIEAYNKGMINNLKELTLEDFVTTDVPKDVVAIDLLYKNEFAPNTYVIKSVEKGDEHWVAGYGGTFKPQGSYTIVTENVYAQIPSNQLIRPWDNVPKKALAQEVTGNRVVYGNYIQGYNLKDAINNKITPKITATINNRFKRNSISKTQKSIKSQRTYNFGIVYGDEYGRETPVFTSSNANQLITKSSSASVNGISIDIENNHPFWADYYKIFVKETSNEYYNLAMGRVYDAKDGNVWLSFPSVDRNKVDEDTYLILKKGVGETGVVLDDARYKVVAIENEAPDYIKTKYTPLAEPNLQTNGYSLIGGLSQTTVEFPSPVQPPYPGQSSFTIRKSAWVDPYSVENTRFGLADLVSVWEDKGESDIYVSFSNKFKVEGDLTPWENVPTKMSKKYKVTDIALPDVSSAVFSGSGGPVSILYSVKLSQAISQQDSFVTDNVSVNFVDGGAFQPHFYTKKVENGAEFDGRFFVKIVEDSIIKEYLPREESPRNQGWKIDATINQLYYISDNSALNVVTGTSGNAASMTPAHWHSNLGSTNGSKWFIDAASFAGLQPSNNAHVYDFIANQDNTPLSDIDSEVHYAVATGSPAGPIPIDLTTSTNTLGLNADESWGDGRSLGAAWLKGAHDGSYNQSLLGDLSTDGSYNAAGTEKFLHLSYGGISPVGSGRDSSGGLWWDFKKQWQNTWWSDFNWHKNWNVGKDGASSYFGGTNSYTDNQEDVVKKLTYGSLFRLVGDPNVYKITRATKRRLYNYRGANRCEDGLQDYWILPTTPTASGALITPSNLTETVRALNYGLTNGGIDEFDDTSVVGQYESMTAPANCRLSYLLRYEVLDGTLNPDISLYSSTAPNVINVGNDLLNSAAFSTNPPTIITASLPGTLEFISNFSTEAENLLPSNPAIFETEPKEDVGLDIYYEASGKKPINKVQSNITNLVQIGAMLDISPSKSVGGVMDGTFVVGIEDAGSNIWNVSTSNLVSLDDLGFVAGETDGSNNVRLKFHNDDGSFAVADLANMEYSVSIAAGVNVDGYGTVSYGVNAIPTHTQNIWVRFIDNTIGLGWWNCWSFGNGVESNRIGDTFNKPFITNGVKASTTLLESYNEERRKYGLIYSGIYNSTSGINDLNQFIAAEKITKDINPVYGSIQRLHSRSTADGDLITLCEDRILKILANKDALYNADGNPQLIANNNVLGQAIPFSGDFGISKNPESLASQSYRIYFTDKVRGAVMRLSKDGLTPISDHGMKDWFRDNLKLSTKLIGSYDDRKDEYNLTLKGEVISKTVTFKENVKGWVSFKSFVPENAISCANEYYTFNGGKLWKHHSEVAHTRNTFYNSFVESSINVILNESPGSIKTFHTLNYEGSQSKVNTFTDWTTVSPGNNMPTQHFNDEYYNLGSKKGWKVQDIHTDQEDGRINEFIEKEGKWFNYIRGRVGSATDTILNDGGIDSGFDNADFSFQGLSRITSAADVSSVHGCTANGLSVNGAGVVNDFFNDGFAAVNYNPLATIDDGGCIMAGLGCTMMMSTNYDPSATTNDGSCIFVGCSDIYATNYDPNAGYPVTPPGAYIFVDDGSCIVPIYGCMWQEIDINGGLVMSNYDPLATVPCNGSLVAGGSQPCATPPFNAPTYTTLGDNCCCVPFVYGCMDPTADNYHPDANTQQTSSIDITNPCFYTVYGCTTSTSCSYNPLANTDDGTCSWCNDNTANNYDGTDANGNEWPCSNGCLFCNDVTNIMLSPTAIPSTHNVSWPASGGAQVDHYNLQYRVDAPGEPWTTISGIVPFQTALFITSHDISGLAESTSYVVQVQAVCSAGTSPLNPSWSTSSAWSASAFFHTEAFPTYGCTDASACNFDPLATADDGACEYTSCAGCTDPAALNYNATSTIDDGSCTYINGCTDSTAINYDWQAVIDDGSCIYPVYGCMDSTLNNAGTAIAATNYNAAATVATGCNYIMPEQWDSIPANHAQSQLLNTNGWMSSGLWGGGTYRRLWAIWDVSLAPKILTQIQFAYEQSFTTSNNPGDITSFNFGSNIWYSNDSGASWSSISNWNVGDAIQLIKIQYSNSGKVEFVGNEAEYPPHITSGYTGEQQAAKFNFTDPLITDATGQSVVGASGTTHTTQVAVYNVMLGCNDATASNYLGPQGFYDNSLCTY